jgi:AcrR family transcriptional regulator
VVTWQPQGPIPRRPPPDAPQPATQPRTCRDASSTPRPTLITEHGVDRLSTRAIATRAGVPVASLYRYFADRDEIILALVQRDTAEMDEQVGGRGRRHTGGTHYPLTDHRDQRAFVRVYHRRPAFVMIWWRGRTNPAVVEFCRAHNREIAKAVHAYANEAGRERAGGTHRDAHGGSAGVPGVVRVRRAAHERFAETHQLRASTTRWARRWRRNRCCAAMRRRSTSPAKTPTRTGPRCQVPRTSLPCAPRRNAWCGTGRDLHRLSRLHRA